MKSLSNTVDTKQPRGTLIKEVWKFLNSKEQTRFPGEGARVDEGYESEDDNDDMPELEPATN